MWVKVKQLVITCQYLLHIFRLPSVNSEFRTKRKTVQGMQENSIELSLKLITDETIANMNFFETSRANGADEIPTVFIVPGAEGTAAMMEDLAHGLDAHVFSLQYSMQTGTIEEISAHLCEVYTKKCIIERQGLVMFLDDKTESSHRKPSSNTCIFVRLCIVHGNSWGTRNKWLYCEGNTY